MILSFRVVRGRESKNILVGDGGDQEMMLRIRCHGNLIENAPIAIILIGFVEVQDWTSWVVHLLGAGFFIARLLHAHGLGTGTMPTRVAGTVGTWATIAGASILILYDYAVAYMS